MRCEPWRWLDLHRYKIYVTQDTTVNKRDKEWIIPVPLPLGLQPRVFPANPYWQPYIGPRGIDMSFNLRKIVKQVLTYLFQVVYTYLTLDAEIHHLGQKFLGYACLRNGPLLSFLKYKD